MAGQNEKLAKDWLAAILEAKGSERVRGSELGEAGKRRGITTKPNTAPRDKILLDAYADYKRSLNPGEKLREGIIKPIIQSIGEAGNTVVDAYRGFGAPPQPQAPIVPQPETLPSVFEGMNGGGAAPGAMPNVLGGGGAVRNFPMTTESSVADMIQRSRVYTPEIGPLQELEILTSIKDIERKNEGAVPGWVSILADMAAGAAASGPDAPVGQTLAGAGGAAGAGKQKRAGEEEDREFRVDQLQQQLDIREAGMHLQNALARDQNQLNASAGASADSYRANALGLQEDALHMPKITGDMIISGTQVQHVPGLSAGRGGSPTSYQQQMTDLNRFGFTVGDNPTLRAQFETAYGIINLGTNDVLRGKAEKAAVDALEDSAIMPGTADYNEAKEALMLQILARGSQDPVERSEFVSAHGAIQGR